MPAPQRMGPSDRAEEVEGCGLQGERERTAPGVHAELPPADERGVYTRPWTKACLDRLIAGDTPAWDRVVAMIEAWSRRRNLSTLEADAVRDYVEDVLLANDMRLLREFREPAAFPGYLAKVTTSRAGHVVDKRPDAEMRPLADIAEKEALRRIAVAHPQAEYSLLKDGPTEYRAALGRAILSFRHALTNRQFSILWLYDVEGQPAARIAQALKITPRAVRKLHDAAISGVRRARSGQPKRGSSRSSRDSDDQAVHPLGPARPHRQRHRGTPQLLGSAPPPVSWRACWLHRQWSCTPLVVVPKKRGANMRILRCGLAFLLLAGMAFGAALGPNQSHTTAAGNVITAGPLGCEYDVYPDGDREVIDIVGNGVKVDLNRTNSETNVTGSGTTANHNANDTSSGVQGNSTTVNSASSTSLTQGASSPRTQSSR